MIQTMYFFIYLLFLIPSTYTAHIDQEKIKSIKHQALLKKLFAQKRTDIISRDSLYELDILPKEDTARTLCGFMDRTVTLCGKLFLEHSITEPITDIDELIKRQETIKKFKYNPELCDLLRAELTIIQKHEHALLAYFDTHNADHAKIDSFYFTNTYTDFANELNSSPTALDLKKNTNTVTNLAWMGSFSYVPLFLYAANNYRLIQAKKEIGDRDLTISWSTIFYNSLADPLNSFNPYLSTIPNKYALTGGDEALVCMQKQKIPLWLAYGVTFGKKIIGLGATYKTVSSMIGFLQKKEKESHQIRTTLESFCCVEESYNRISELLGLEKNTAFYISSHKKMGELLIMHKKIQESKTILENIARTLGELDAFLAIADTMQELETAEKPCCFVKFNNSPHAEITLDSCWNPLTYTEKLKKISTNSLFLGGISPTRGWVITGPHGCGKSTIMRSVAINILCSQSMGIAFAKYAELSCFDSINTYLTISEDRDKGWSTFMAEQDAAETILKKIKNSQKSFTVFDELFKGTLEKEGGKRVCDLGLKIAALPNALCMIATHAHKPTELEEKTNQIFKNYHGEIVDCGNGIFEHTYSFLPGENRWWFTDDAKRSRFIDHLALSRNKTQ